MAGMVYLVGAGPGDPGLVTAKGLDRIKKADCIIYDRLASPELLAYARADCECIYVGKADSHHTLPQEEINALLVEKAHAYRSVVRLKGGDVYVFGRGGEEGMYLREHNIPFTVVPGVSSAIAGAACAGIPVTHRGIAAGFRVITAHSRMDETAEMDFSTMLDPKETLIFLMGLGRVGIIAEGLIGAGRAADTPVAVISHATMATQRVCVGVLSDIADKVHRQQLTSPAMIVVGEVVTLRSQLNFREQQPLCGKSFLVPKIGQEPSRLAALLREKGAQVTERVVGQLVGIPAVYTEKELSQVDVLLFTSANGVHYFMRNLFMSELDVRAIAHAKLVAIGPKTSEKLKEYGLRADLVPQQYNSDTLVQEIRQFAAAACHREPFGRAVIWHPTAKNADDGLVDELLEVCDCGRLNVYENVACELDENNSLLAYDGILFTCASSAERLLGKRDETVRASLASHTAVYSIGPKCSAALSALGVSPVTESAMSTYEGLLHTVLTPVKF